MFLYNWLFNSWTVEEIIDAIDKIQEKRKKRRLDGLTMKSSFADDLKDYIKGIEINEESNEKEKMAVEDVENENKN